MTFSKTTLFLVIVLISKVVASQEGDTTSFAFDSFSEGMGNVTFQQDAFVPPSSSFVRLTVIPASNNTFEYSIGRLVYSPLVNFWDEGLQASFNATIKFLIRPQTGIPGHGITFFIAQPNSQNFARIPYEGNLGLFDYFSGNAPSVFAVEFDLVPDYNWDPRYPHIGIDINSRISRRETRFENSIGQEVTAHISYVSSTRTITVVATYGSETSTLSYVFDLKTILPKQVEVGVSATNGPYTTFIDLHAWNFTSTLNLDATSNFDQRDNIRQYV